MIKTTLPPEDYSLVIRTDFSDDAAWKRVSAAIGAELGPGWQAMVECISDRSCEGLSPEAVCRLVPDTDVRLFVFIVDSHTLGQPHNPVLVVDTEESSLQFRVVPQQAWAVENNLWLANMGLEDFQAALGPDGVFRGIERP